MRACVCVDAAAASPHIISLLSPSPEPEPARVFHLHRGAGSGLPRSARLPAHLRAEPLLLLPPPRPLQVAPPGPAPGLCAGEDLSSLILFLEGGWSLPWSPGGRRRWGTRLPEGTACRGGGTRPAAAPGRTCPRGKETCLVQLHPRGRRGAGGRDEGKPLPARGRSPRSPKVMLRRETRVICPFLRGGGRWVPLPTPISGAELPAALPARRHGGVEAAWRGRAHRANLRQAGGWHQGGGETSGARQRSHAAALPGQCIHGRRWRPPSPAAGGQARGHWRREVRAGQGRAGG